MRMHILDWRSEVFKVKYYVMFVLTTTLGAVLDVYFMKDNISQQCLTNLKNSKPMFASTFARDKNFANGQWW